MPADNYFSVSDRYELLLKEILNEEPISIENQIKITYESLMSTIS
jgi:hypothetical protein